MYRICYGKDPKSDFITSWKHHDQNDDSCKTLSSVNPESSDTESGHRYTTASIQNPGAQMNEKFPQNLGDDSVVLNNDVLVLEAVLFSAADTFRQTHI